MKLSLLFYAFVATAVFAETLDDLPDIPGAYSQNSLLALGNLKNSIQTRTTTISNAPNCGLVLLLGAIEQGLGLTDGSACPQADTAVANELIDLRSMMEVAEVQVNEDYFQDDKTGLTLISDEEAVAALDNIAQSFHSLLLLLQRKTCQFRLTATSSVAWGLTPLLLAYDDLVVQLGFPFSAPYSTGDFPAQDSSIRADFAKLDKMTKETNSGPTLITCLKLAFNPLTKAESNDEDPPTSAAGITAQPFLLPIEDVFSISGRGTVVTGRIERGVIKVGDEVEILGIKDTVKSTCTGVETFRKLLSEGRAGENVGILLRGIKREDIERGQVLALPGSILPHTKFESEVYILSTAEGGRSMPFYRGYRPQLYLRTTDVTTTTLELPEGVEMVRPGDNVDIVFTLIHPVALEEGQRFAIREGGRTVGAGVVAKILD